MEQKPSTLTRTDSESSLPFSSPKRRLIEAKQKAAYFEEEVSYERKQ